MCHPQSSRPVVAFAISLIVRSLVDDYYYFSTRRQTTMMKSRETCFTQPKKYRKINNCVWQLFGWQREFWQGHYYQRSSTTELQMVVIVGAWLWWLYNIITAPTSPLYFYGSEMWSSIPQVYPTK